MHTTVEGIWTHGHVELREVPADIQEGATVLVTFLAPTEPRPPAEARSTAEERVRAFHALVASLPEAPPVPLDAFAREDLYP